MDNTNIQSTSIPCENWRADMTMEDRTRFIRQLAQALKQLSPGTNDDSILIAAKNFENTVYNRSANKNQYLLAYSTKFRQIKYQLDMQMRTKAVPAGGSGDPNTATMSSSMAPQPTTSPQLQRVHQQAQNMPNLPTQQVFMQPQNLTQSITSQPTLIQNQHPSNHQIQYHNSSEMVTPQPMASLPMTSQDFSAQTLMTPNQQQQQQQLQVFMARQRALQQQQQQQQQQMTQATAASNMNTINRPAMPANYFVTSTQEAIPMLRQNPLANTLLQPPPALAAQFKLQQEQLLQNQQLQLSTCNPSNQLQLQQVHQRQIQQLRMHHARQLQLVNQQRLAAFQQQQLQSPQTNALTQGQPGTTPIQQQQPGQINTFIQNQPVMTPIQQQQQPGHNNAFIQKQPMTTGMQQQLPHSPQINMSGQQRIQANNMIRQLDENIRLNKVPFQALENLTDQEKKAIWETVMQMRPMYEKITQLLPIFLSLTSNIAGTRRLIVMKYMFEDQLNALPRNIYLMTLERLQQLRYNFNGYFTYVRNAMNPGSTQGQPQVNHQTPSVSRAETSINTSTSSPTIHQTAFTSPLSKRDDIDLMLPPSKRQRATTDQQPTMDPQVSNSTTDIPATTYCSPMANVPAVIPDCAQAATIKAEPTSSSATNKETIFTGPVLDATQQQQQQQQLRTTMIENDAQSQPVNQVAIRSGIPSDIVAILPPQALKCIWLLHQASLNKMQLLDEQKAHIRRMLDEFIGQAKKQLGIKYHSNQQHHDTLKVDLQKSHTIDLTLSPPPPPVTTNFTTWTMENSPVENGMGLELSLPLQDLGIKREPNVSTSVSSATDNETTNMKVSVSSVANSPIVSTTVTQPATLATSPISSTNVRPDTATDVMGTNSVLVGNDASKETAVFMTSSPPLTETTSTPLFVMDDIIIDGNNKAGMTMQGTGQTFTNNGSKTDHTTFFSTSASSSESSTSLVLVALKEGYKDETFCINELDSTRPSSSLNTTTNGPSPSLDQSSNASSLSSTSLSSSTELNDDLAKNGWYQMGVDKDSLGITDTIPGLEFDGDGFISSYDSGNRLSHPPLF